MRKSLVTFLASIALSFSMSTPSSAHAEFVGSNPADKSTVVVAPETISLEFNEPMLPMGSAIALVAPDGTTIPTDDVTVAATTLSVPWPTEMPLGEITTNWRATSDDGHVISGSFTFTVAKSDVIASPMANDATATPMVISGNEESSERSTSPWLPVVGGIAIIVMGAFIAGRFRK